MWGGGFMLQAIQSLKFNKEQRASSKFSRPDWKDYHINYNEVGYDPIKATPELLEEIRTQKQLENKKRKNRDILFAILSLLIVIIFFIYLSNSINGFL
ncbi:hypothetical protein [Flavobacterium sp.]|uniref:hypothetical protein n=1 Tax=Flavobacterium sp. TaxID=239 RepID=UPI003529CEF8